MSSEARQLEIFGEKLYFETNTDRVDANNGAAYVLASQTSDKVKYNQSLHEGSGDSRIYAEKDYRLSQVLKVKQTSKHLILESKMVMAILLRRMEILQSVVIKS